MASFYYYYYYYFIKLLTTQLLVVVLCLTASKMFVSLLMSEQKQVPRPALQTLPENLMPAGGPKNEN